MIAVLNILVEFFQRLPHLLTLLDDLCSISKNVQLASSFLIVGRAISSHEYLTEKKPPTQRSRKARVDVSRFNCNLHTFSCL